MGLLTSLRTGKVNNYSGKPVDKGYKGIIGTDIFTTYLDYEGAGEGNFDYIQELCKGKDRKEDKTYYQLPNQKDVWVEARLWGEFQKLLEEIKLVNPTLIIVTGKWSLFFLTGCVSLINNTGNYKDKKPLGCLNKFRSSILQASEGYNLSKHILIPIFHTVHAITMPDKLTTMELDIQKLGWMYNVIKDKGVEYYIRPEKRFDLAITKDIAIRYLNALLHRLADEPIKLSIDIETMFHSTIDCIGIAASIDYGLCIPFAHKGNANYWSIEDETDILVKLREVMLHPNTIHVGQNYSYDCQYFWKLWGLHIIPNEDTMVLHHILYNYLPKNLAFLASCYAEFYTYWKDDIEALSDTPETRWIYNVKDVCYTLEILEILEDLLAGQDNKTKELYRFQMDKLSPCLISTMNKGVKVDTKLKSELYTFFSKMLEDIVISIKDMLGVDFNLNSHVQKKKIFSDFLEMKLKIKRGSDTETCDAAAMLEYVDDYPLYKPFLLLLLEHASLKVFTNNFLGMELDDDERARTQYRIAGTDTGRLASTKNVWGKGANLQNIPSKGKIDLRYSLQTYSTDEEEVNDDSLINSLSYEGTIKLPNIKKIFIPDAGKEIADADYSGADIMVVAADSGCRWLLDFFANPKGKVYKYIASEFFQREITDKEYKMFKGVFHGSNYLMGVDKLASMAGISYTQAKKLQDFYFYLNPEIRKWQENIAKEVAEKGYLTTVFGRKRWFLNKQDPMLMNKATAFKPSATIADLVNHGWVSLSEKLPYVDTLMQTHDSLTCQYDIGKAEEARKGIVEAMQIPLKYPAATLIIPAELAYSLTSYGDCH
jgi:DNA polymerase I-like protein with 3'-5' exonuclease and polymerase domains